MCPIKTAKSDRLGVLGGKAIIKQNKFGVWQFRMWISSEKKYVEKLLCTKKKTDAMELIQFKSYTLISYSKMSY